MSGTTDGIGLQFEINKYERERRAKKLCDLLEVKPMQEFGFQHLMCSGYGPVGTEHRITKEGFIQMWDCNRGHWCFATGNVIEDWLNGSRKIVRWPVIEEEKEGDANEQ